MTSHTDSRTRSFTHRRSLFATIGLLGSVASIVGLWWTFANSGTDENELQVSGPSISIEGDNSVIATGDRQIDVDSSQTDVDNSETNIDNSQTDIDNSQTDIDNSQTNIDNSGGDVGSNGQNTSTGSGGATQTPTTVTCPDGSTVTEGTECPTQTITCPDGTIIRATDSCPIRTTKCPDGSTVTEGTECPTQTITCPDGSTIPATETCPTGDPEIELVSVVWGDGCAPTPCQNGTATFRYRNSDLVILGAAVSASSGIPDTLYENEFSATASSSWQTTQVGLPYIEGHSTCLGAESRRGSLLSAPILDCSYS